MLRYLCPQLTMLNSHVEMPGFYRVLCTQHLEGLTMPSLYKLRYVIVDDRIDHLEENIAIARCRSIPYEALFIVNLIRYNISGRVFMSPKIKMHKEIIL